ncbi:MAG: hypothetical protein H0X12_04960 [Nocardioides sp.]|nr:hypothetical protein [Nocardioides sp.]
MTNELPKLGDGLEWLTVSIPVNSAQPIPAAEALPLLQEAYGRAIASRTGDGNE